MSVTHLEGKYDLVLYGLGVMGENFIRNFAHKGYRVIGVNRTVAVTERFAKEAAEEGITDKVGTAETLVEACKALKSPGGAVLAMINANDPVINPTGPIDDLFFKGSVAKYSDTDQRPVPAARRPDPRGHGHHRRRQLAPAQHAAPLQGVRQARHPLHRHRRERRGGGRAARPVHHAGRLGGGVQDRRPDAGEGGRAGPRLLLHLHR